MLIYFGAITNHSRCEGLTDEIQPFYALAAPTPGRHAQLPGSDPPSRSHWLVLFPLLEIGVLAVL